MQGVIRSTRVRIAALAATAMMAVGLAAAPAASAQQQEGLVNVNISNNNVSVPITATVPVNAAANICGVDVGVLTGLQTTFTNCQSQASQHQTITVSPVTG